MGPVDELAVSVARRLYHKGIALEGLGSDGIVVSVARRLYHKGIVLK